MSKENEITDNDFFMEVSQLLEQARNKAYQSVNSIMVETYWQIGKRIVAQEEHGRTRAAYGKKLIAKLSIHLSEYFGKGFSEANLWNMKQFFQTFPDYSEFSTHCVGNLSWTNARHIKRLDNPKERIYYLCEASSQNPKYKTVLPTEKELETMLSANHQKLLE